jgi:hypothetical protein
MIAQLKGRAVRKEDLAGEDLIPAWQCDEFTRKSIKMA